MPEYITDNIYNYSPTMMKRDKSTDGQEAETSSELFTSVSSKVTKEDILTALATCKNNRTEAAKMLGISRRTFYRKLNQLGISE